MNQFSVFEQLAPDNHTCNNICKEVETSAEDETVTHRDPFPIASASDFVLPGGQLDHAVWSASAP